jgi:hypothetical protein
MLWFLSIPLSNGYRATLPPGEKRLRHEADHSPPSSTVVKNGGVIPRLYHTSLWGGAELIRHRGNFTFFTFIYILEIWFEDMK